MQCSQLPLLLTQSTARSSTVRSGGSAPVWTVNNELRLAFESLRTGDRLMLCISAFDEDVTRDDLIGTGHVDITDVAYRDAGVPGLQV